MWSICLASMWFFKFVRWFDLYSLWQTRHCQPFALMPFSIFPIILVRSSSYFCNSKNIILYEIQPMLMPTPMQDYFLDEKNFLIKYSFIHLCTDPTCFLKLALECFLMPQYWHEYSTPSRWVLSKCSTVWLFVSIFPQIRHSHPPATLVMFSFSKSSSARIYLLWPFAIRICTFYMLVIHIFRHNAA